MTKDSTTATLSKAEQAKPLRAVSIRASVSFSDGSTFSLIHGEASDGCEECAVMHPRGIFPNEAAEFWHRLMGSDATADDMALMARLQKALDDEKKDNSTR